MRRASTARPGSRDGPRAYARGRPGWRSAGFRDLPADDRFLAVPLGAAAVEYFEEDGVLGAGGDIAGRPADPILPQAAPPVRNSRWRAAIAVSLSLHVAVALLFLAVDDRILIAGSEEAGIALFGDAPEDSASAGDPVDRADVTNVTIIPMVTATAVEATRAESAPAEAVTGEHVAAVAAQVERVRPVEEAHAAEVVESTGAIETAEHAPAEPVRAVASQVVEPERVVPSLATMEVASAAPVEEWAIPLPPADAPEVLAAVRAERADSVVAQPAEPVRAEPTQPVEVAPTEPTIVEATEPSVEATPPAPKIAAKRVEPVKSARAIPVVEAPAAPSHQAAPTKKVHSETVVARAPEETSPVEEVAAKPVPVPEPKPVRELAEPKRRVDSTPAKSAEPKQKPERPAKPRAAKKDDANRDKPEKPAASGSGGRDQADARKGVADGRPDERSAKNTGSARQSAAGNAAVTNYPGKVASKLRRALRAPAESKRKKLTGEVRVSFVVNASGGVGSVRVVRSSGSPILDRAAVEAVHRAAPFPAIPAGAGRSSWPFTVPLAFSR